MAYLLTQILFCLALAALVGGVAGWLLNGFRAAKNEKQIRTELMRQSLALNQAETDNKMIEDDYRDLKFRSEEAISLLKEETRKIPVLNQNLDKSQTLVRQLLQKHEAEKRQIESENNILATKLRELESRENAVTRLQMDLNTERLQIRSKEPANADAPELQTPESQVSGSQVSDPISDSSPIEQTELTLDASDTDETQIEIDSLDNLHTDVAQDQLTSKADKSEAINDDLEEETEERSLNKSGAEITHVDDSNENNSADEGNTDENTEVSPEENPGTEDEKTATDSIPAVVPNSSSPDKQASTTRDFGNAEYSDDLKKIFGIGPVTIKTLNVLGIKNYAQIAKLNREDIEYIAQELQIFPGRIERDNWVGSAKKLLAEEQARKAENSEQLEDA